MDATIVGFVGEAEMQVGPLEGPVFPILPRAALAFTASPTFTVRLPGCKCE